MPRLDFSVAPMDAPRDEAYGPEAATWARLELRVDDMSLTRHQDHDAFVLSAVPADDAVEGPLNGIAEWLVDQFANVLWDTSLPVRKHASVEGTRTPIPSLRDAAKWWSDVPYVGERRVVAEWQQRHTLGASLSQLALPSFVFMPEAGRIGLFVTPPPNELNANVRFRLPEGGSEFWLDRNDLREKISQFVDGIIALAAASEDGKKWATWLEARWKEIKELERSPDIRRKLMFGVAVADAWKTRIEPLGNRKSIVEGVLSDVPPIGSPEPLEVLLQALSLEGRESSNDRGWRKLVPKEMAVSLKPYEQGYDVARVVRREMNLGADPIDRMDVLLTDMDIADREAESAGLFRSLSYVRDRQASVVVSTDVKGVVPRRVALAAALGRLLIDSRGRDWGAGVGDQSRWQETQRARAFAAELLAPAEAVRNYPEDPERLAADYGISLSAARWRIKNVFHSAA